MLTLIIKLKEVQVAGRTAVDLTCDCNGAGSAREVAMAEHVINGLKQVREGKTGVVLEDKFRITPVGGRN